jgi:hypothetical protein
MNGVLSVSKLMKGSQVRKECERMRKERALLLVVELQAKERLYQMNHKVFH